MFDTTFIGSWWNEQEQRHDILLQRADGTTFRVKANVLISAAGPLNTPRFPNIPGHTSYKGVQFHSSQWDPKLVLENRRFAIVGSGSTAVQLTPGLATSTGVYVTQFMRSPGWYLPKVSAILFHSNSTWLRNTAVQLCLSWLCKSSICLDTWVAMALPRPAALGCKSFPQVCPARADTLVEYQWDSRSTLTGKGLLATWYRRNLEKVCP